MPTSRQRLTKQYQRTRDLCRQGISQVKLKAMKMQHDMEERIRISLVPKREIAFPLRYVNHSKYSPQAEDRKHGFVNRRAR